MLFTLRASTRLVRRRNNFNTLPAAPTSTSTSSSTPSSSAPLSTSSKTPPSTPTTSSAFTLRTPHRNRLQKPQRRQSSPHAHHLLSSPSTPSLRSTRSYNTIRSNSTFRSSHRSYSLSAPLPEETPTTTEASEPAGPDLRHLPTLEEGNVTIINPRKDEDGNIMSVTVTPRAINRLRTITATESHPSLLRITVESGGCHGFQYLMSLVPPTSINTTDDTIIDCHNGARVVMDESSLELLKGSRVDYTMELIGSQFKIVGNPRASSSCGCGTSFDIKF